MANKSSPSSQPAQLPQVVVGEPCPCCGRKVAGPKLTEEERQAKRKEYQSRPEVQERRKAYNAKRNAELRELRKLQQELEAQRQSPNGEARDEA